MYIMQSCVYCRSMRCNNAVIVHVRLHKNDTKLQKLVNKMPHKLSKLQKMTPTKIIIENKEPQQNPKFKNIPILRLQ